MELLLWKKKKQLIWHLTSSVQWDIFAGVLISHFLPYSKLQQILTPPLEKIDIKLTLVYNLENIKTYWYGQN